MKIAHTVLNLTMALACVSAMAADPKATGDGNIKSSHGEPAGTSQGAVVNQAASKSKTQTPVTGTVDGSMTNQADMNAEKKTAQDPSASAKDRELMASVRRAIVADKSLSIMGHATKISAKGGMVTLHGNVKDAAEKAKIEELAMGVSGTTGVDNQLNFKANVSTK